MAGFIKTVLALENGLIPPNILFSKPNPAIPLDEWNMTVVTIPTPWPATPIRRASVSSFGMGGTNGHVVLEAYQPDHVHSGLDHGLVKTIDNGLAIGFRSVSDRKTRLFVFSSHDQAGLKRIGNSLVEYIDGLGASASRPGYMADIAHTLATARSGLGWKASCFAENAVELRDCVSNLTGEHATRPIDSPRIALVFTGQGAQWPRMGIEMLTRPVFSESITKSAAYLTELGCDWNLPDELRSSTDSRLSLPEIAQPLCTALQIALVDELRAWGVRPSKVTGHSSGEIAAAYCVGALTHRDALSVAFFRGKASAGLKKAAPQLHGGMMAVGCTQDEIEALLATIRESRVTVACINSPKSLTLSGDATALSELETILKDRQIFTRRLKVEVAYHSSHMKVIANDYSSYIEEIEPSDLGEALDRPIMISSVTGAEVAPEMLGPFYWLRNLLSPVLFMDAIKELVLPGAARRESVEFLIEIGPHSTLNGPIEQTLSHYGLGNTVPKYMSMMQRGCDSAETSRQLAQELFHRGACLDIAAVNADSASQRHLLTDLPPYPWKHDKAYSAVSRLQKELMWREFPTRSLIGAKMPMMDETQHVWRGFIRLDDEPWLRGHKVGNTTLLPGAGMCSMALEAGQQLAGLEMGKTVRAFKLRDVSFSAALAIPEDTAVEVVLNIRPHLLGTTGQTPPTWWEFTLSSSSGVDQLRDNCHGLLAIEYEEGQSPQMALEKASFAAQKVDDYHRIFKQYEGRACSQDAFYRHIAKSGFQYGELFQAVEDVRMGMGNTTFGIRIKNVGDTFSKGQAGDQTRPFLLSGATLDAVFQDWMGSTCDDTGALGFDKPFAPTYLGELEVSTDIPATDGYVMPGFCTSQRYGFNELSSNSYLFDEALGKLYLSVVDFRISLLDDVSGEAYEGLDSESDSPSAITSEVRWGVALDVMDPTDALKLVRGSTPDDQIIEVSTFWKQ